jgi:non-ribosomal peptide synthase protein (TIGR01720 family)
MDQPWNEVSAIPLDFDAEGGSNTYGSAAAVDSELTAEETRRLLDGHRRPENVIIAALAGCLSDWTSSPTVLIDFLSHGRDAAVEGVNLARTVGFTLSFNPLVLSHSTWDGTPETLATVTAQIDRLPEGFTFELLRFLAADSDVRDRLNALPRAELLFNYAGTPVRPGNDAPWQEVAGPTGPDESPRGQRQYLITVRATVAPNLRLTYTYSKQLHQAATIEAKAAEVAATIRGLLADPLSGA